MRNYGQRFCPIARASEILAERWTPIIVRNLLLGCNTFGQLLEGAPGISRSLLAQRLRELERNGIVERSREGGGRGPTYALTAAGRDLEAVCDAMGAWGERWLDAAPTGLDPGTVLWAVAKSMDKQHLPDERVVIRFAVGRRSSFWMLVQRPAAELCRKNPGLDEDLVVTVNPTTLAAWHMGRISLRQARSAGEMRIEGVPKLVRAFARWGGQSPFAGAAAR